MQRYQNIIANANTGLPVNGAQVYVLDYGTSTQATIYSDDGISPVAQPLQTDALGSFYFYAANGRYTVNIYYNAALVGSLPDILLQDAADPLTVDITGGTINATTIGATTPSTSVFTSANISNATINGGTANSVVIGGTTPAAATFTTATATSMVGSSFNGGTLGGRRNRIINGNFQINQRVVSGSVVLGAGIYGHDRWKGGAAGCSYTFSTSGVDTTLTISAGSLKQVIAGENIAASTYVLSWTGTAQANFNGGGFSNSPLAITGITPGANLTIEFGTGTVGLVQCEPGTVVTPYERRLLKEELENCQYYYEKSYDYTTAIAATTAVGAYKFQLNGLSSAAHSTTLMITYAVPKIAVPTVTLYSYATGASGKVRDVVGAADVTPSATSYSTKSGIVDVTGSTTATSVIMVAHWTAEAEL